MKVSSQPVPLTRGQLIHYVNKPKTQGVYLKELSLCLSLAKLQSIVCGQLVKSCSRLANAKLLPVQLSMYPVSSFCTPLPFSTLHIHFLFLAFLFLFISAVKPLKYPRSSSGSEGCPIRGSLFNLTVQFNLPSAPLLTVYVEKLPHIWSQQCSVLN